MSALEYLKQIPFGPLTRFIEWVRRRAPLRYPWPEDVDHVVVDASPTQAEAALRAHHWEDPTPYALKYEGEQLNLRRPDGIRDDGLPAEDHLRARVTGAGLAEIAGHHEASRLEAKTPHVHSEGLEWYDADELAALLEAADLEIVDFELADDAEP